VARGITLLGKLALTITDPALAPADVDRQTRFGDRRCPMIVSIQLSPMVIYIGTRGFDKVAVGLVEM
jgi:hypothetical protein